MATQKSPKKSTATEPPPTLGDRILDAGLDEAAVVGWRMVSMDAVATRAGLKLGEVLLQVPGKMHLLFALMDRIDARMLAPVAGIDADDTPRDRLFELLMRRFDALNDKREGARAFVTGASRDPLLGLAALCRAERSAVAILSAAGISTGGFLGLARINGLKAVVGCALKAWMEDDSADLAKTMATLDRALARAEKLADFMNGRRRSSPPESSEGDAQARA